MKARPSVAKRQKERARAEKKRIKAMKRAERRYESENSEPRSALDISHIKPGPQPIEPWEDEEEENAAEE